MDGRSRCFAPLALCGLQRRQPARRFFGRFRLWLAIYVPLFFAVARFRAGRPSYSFSATTSVVALDPMWRTMTDRG